MDKPVDDIWDASLTKGLPGLPINQWRRDARPFIQNFCLTWNLR